MTSVLLLLPSAVANAACWGYLKFSESLAMYLLNVSALQRKQYPGSYQYHSGTHLCKQEKTYGYIQGHKNPEHLGFEL